MDISVKNEYDRLSTACETIELLSSTTETSLMRLLAEDVFAFISLISKKNAKERYDYFDAVYQGGNYSSSTMGSIDNEEYSRLFLLLNKFSNTSMNEATVRPDSLYISFLLSWANRISWTVLTKEILISRSSWNISINFGNM